MYTIFVMIVVEAYIENFYLSKTNLNRHEDV